MGCGQSATMPTKDQSKGHMLAQPKARGKRIPLFNGLLYRIEDEGNGKWAFFNNSNDYEFHVKYLFGASSQIDAAGDTNLEIQDDGILCSVVVFPLETKEFITGTPDGYESKLEALPLSEEFFGRHPELNEHEYYRRLEAPKTAAF